MLKRFNKEKTQCPRGLFEEINAVCFEKCLKFNPNLTKMPNIEIFETFLQFLSVF